MSSPFSPSFFLSHLVYIFVTPSPYHLYSPTASNTYIRMSYRGRYADYDDEPSRRQAPRDDVSFPHRAEGQADPQRQYQSRYEDIPSTPTQRTRADDPSGPNTREVPIPFRGGPHPPQSPPPSISARSFPPPTEAFSTLSVSASVNPSIAGGVQRSEVSHLRGIEAVERRLTQLKPSPFAVRPGHGVAGKALTVKTNYFQVRPWNGETPKIIQYVSCQTRPRIWEGADDSHYDVEIDPHVKVVNQKKPKALLRAVWEQLVLEQKNDPWVGPFSASAFDGRKNAYTPIEFPMGRGTSSQLAEALRHKLMIRKLSNIHCRCQYRWCRPKTWSIFWIRR